MLAFALALATATPAAALTPDPYQIFALARRAWLLQEYPKTIDFKVALADDRYVRHYAARYEPRTGTLVASVISDEVQQQHYVPPEMSISIGPIPIGPKEVPDDPLGIPRLTPNYSFGIAPTGFDRALTSEELIQKIRSQFPNPRQPISVHPSGEKEIGVVYSRDHDYLISYVGMDVIDARNTFHLALQPTHDAWHHRLRDLWVDTQTFRTRRLISQGNFVAGGSTKVRWQADYQTIDGAQYLYREKELAGTYSVWFEGISAAPTYDIAKPLPQTPLQFLTEPD